MAELVLGKYEFYPYELEKDKTPALEDLKDLLRKARADNKKTTGRRSRPVIKRGPKGK